MDSLIIGSADGSKQKNITAAILLSEAKTQVLLHPSEVSLGQSESPLAL
jgi:hypothetical protein